MSCSFRPAWRWLNNLELWGKEKQSITKFNCFSISNLKAIRSGSALRRTACQCCLLPIFSSAIHFGEEAREKERTKLGNESFLSTQCRAASLTAISGFSWRWESGPIDCNLSTPFQFESFKWNISPIWATRKSAEDRSGRWSVRCLQCVFSPTNYQWYANNWDLPSKAILQRFWWSMIITCR